MRKSEYIKWATYDPVTVNPTPESCPCCGATWTKTIQDDCMLHASDCFVLRARRFYLKMRKRANNLGRI